MKAADPLAVKRRKVADAMRAADKDSATLEHDLARLPEAQLDLLLDHYDGASQHVW